MIKMVLLSLRPRSAGGWLKLALGGAVLIGMATIGMVVLASVAAVGLAVYGLSRLGRSSEPRPVGGQRPAWADSEPLRRADQPFAGPITGSVKVIDAEYTVTAPPKPPAS